MTRTSKDKAGVVVGGEQAGRSLEPADPVPGQGGGAPAPPGGAPPAKGAGGGGGRKAAAKESAARRPAGRKPAAPAQSGPRPEEVAEATAAARRELQALREESSGLARQLEEVKRHADGLGQQLREVGRQALSEVTAQAQALRRELYETGGELEELRRQSRDAQHLLGEEVLGRSQALRAEFAETEGRWQEARGRFEEVAVRLAEQMDSQMGQLWQGLAEVRQLLQAFPEELQQFSQYLRELWRQLPKAGQQVDAIQHELAGVKQDLQEAREEVGKVKQEARGAGGERGQENAAPEGHNRLGVTVGPGVVVAEVQPGSPAERAGLAPGDVLAAVDGVPVLDAAGLRDLIRGIPDGREVTVRVLRRGVVGEAKARLEAAAVEPPAAEGQNRLGVTVETGVVVAKVLPDTPAERAGLAAGDVLAAVDGRAVFDAAGLRDAVQPHAAGEEVTLAVVRGREKSEVKVRLDDAPPGPGTAA